MIIKSYQCWLKIARQDPCKRKKVDSLDQGGKRAEKDAKREDGLLINKVDTTQYVSTSKQKNLVAGMQPYNIPDPKLMSKNTLMLKTNALLNENVNVCTCTSAGKLKREREREREREKDGAF